MNQDNRRHCSRLPSCSCASRRPACSWNRDESRKPSRTRPGGARPMWAQIGAFGAIWTQMGGAPSGRVRGGLRLSSRFQLHAGRQEARKRDGSLGNASNKDVTRDERGKASRRGDIRITEKKHPIIKFMRCVSTFGSENANGTLWSDVWWV